MSDPLKELATRAAQAEQLKDEAVQDACRLRDSLALYIPLSLDALRTALKAAEEAATNPQETPT